MARELLNPLRQLCLQGCQDRKSIINMERKIKMQEKLITRKVVLSLAGVLAAAAFAPEASALPAFARQVGKSCTACHMQHFPVLNSYGRDFKASGYTMMGSQGKIKDEGLSIPNTLNAALLVKARYQKDNTAGVANTNTQPAAKGNGQIQFGDEFSLFFGGRVAENIGFLFEGNTANVGGSLLAGFKLPIMFNVGETARISVIPFTTDALSVQYGYEMSSGGVLRANRWAEHRAETSAIQYNADRGADGGAATGIAFVAQNDFGFINLTKFSPSFAPGGNAQNIPSSDIFSNSYVRIAATPTVSDWAMVVGAGAMSGTGHANLAVADIATKQTFFDFQAHGMVAEKELGVYFQHANAPATLDSTGLVNNNAYNPNANTRKATTIGADYSVIPHTLHIGAAYRNAKNGAAAGVDGDNAWTVTGVYDMYQNVAFHINYSAYSGSAHDAAGSVKHLTTLMLEAAW